ncbi:unnamed protein product (mitochondrion) [Plasmodiophora brassicae]|uniref:DNA-directed DNA polymerase n=1 Tax=Plasmodiophora brassicae TaxID=37360 RepID=A0A3P3YNV9_PLABS|nr:unnamed protein product [Plasmodiophora brassicae]
MGLGVLRDDQLPDLEAVLDAVLDGRQTPRADAALHRIRHAILRAVRDPGAAIDLKGALGSQTCAADDDRRMHQPRARRPNPLNEPRSSSPSSSTTEDQPDDVALSQPFASATRSAPATRLPLQAQNAIIRPSRPKDQRFAKPTRSQSQIVNQFVASAIARYSSGDAPRQDALPQGPTSPVESSSLREALTADGIFTEITAVEVKAITDANDPVAVTVVTSDGSNAAEYLAEGDQGTGAAIVIVIISARATPFVHFLHQKHNVAMGDGIARALVTTNAKKVVFDCKALLSLLYRDSAMKPVLLSAVPIAGTFDVKLGAWMLNPDLPPDALTFSAICALMGSSRSGNDQRLPFSWRAVSKATCAARIQRFITDLIQTAESICGHLNDVDRRLMQCLENEGRLASLLSLIEDAGVEFDAVQLAAQREIICNRIRDLQSACWGIAGHEFNLSSADQVSGVLYDELKLVPPCVKESGHRSTAESALTALKQGNPFVQYLLEYRSLSKLLRTYVEPYIASEKRTPGHIKATWNQMSCATGRLSSSGPNLQSLPKQSTDVPISQAGVPCGVVSVNVRRAFSCTSDGYVLISADYNQMEVRVLAALADDPGLIDAVSMAHDVYQVFAGKIFLKQCASVSESERNQAKTLCLGIIYGMGPAALSKQLSALREVPCSIAEAKALDKQFFGQFPKLKTFINSTHQFCRDHGFVKTITGRCRHLPDIVSPDSQLRLQAERQSVNTIIQGSASDIMKAAMLALMAKLRDADLSQSVTIRMQVHDELVVSCRKSRIQYVAKCLRDAMQDNDVIRSLGLTIPVSTRVGRNLGDMTCLIQRDPNPTTCNSHSTRARTTVFTPRTPSEHRTADTSSSASSLSAVDIPFVMSQVAHKLQQFRYGSALSPTSSL